MKVLLNVVKEVVERTNYDGQAVDVFYLGEFLLLLVISNFSNFILGFIKTLIHSPPSTNKLKRLFFNET